MSWALLEPIAHVPTLFWKQTMFILQPQRPDHRVENAEEPAGQLNPLQPALPAPGD